MQPDAAQHASPWQRVSAWALVPLLGKSAWEFFGLILGGAFLSSRDKYAVYMPYVLALLALLVLGRAIIGWRFSRFRVTAQGIELEKGLLHKEKLLLPQARVQHVTVSQGPLQKQFGLATLKVFTAGGLQAEAALSDIDDELAQLLCQQLSQLIPQEERADAA